MNRNKLKMIITIAVSVIILTFGTVMIIKLNKNHQASKMIIEKCFESEGPVIVVKKGFLSPATCETT